MLNLTYTMKETCKKTGLNYDTLKFYCNEGLVPNVKRDKHNYHIFDDNNIAWIKSLSCFKKLQHEYWRNEKIFKSLS